MSNTVLLDVKDGIGYITINRPAALNALSSEVLTDLNLVLDEVEKHEEIRVVIVSGKVIRLLLQGLILRKWTKCLQFKPSNT